jgi:hypothetical protein
MTVRSPESSDRLQACGDMLFQGQNNSHDYCSEIERDDPLDPVSPSRPTLGQLCSVCSKNAVCHKVRKQLVTHGVRNVDGVRADSQQLYTNLGLKQRDLNDLQTLTQQYCDVNRDTLQRSVFDYCDGSGRGFKHSGCHSSSSLSGPL